MKDKPKWKKTLFKQGKYSTVITLPPEILDYLETKAGDTVHIIADKGKHGRYIAIWNPKQKEK